MIFRREVIGQFHCKSAPFLRECKGRGYRRRAEQGEMMARGIDFRKPRLGEYTAASSLCLCQHPPEVLHCSRNRISVSSGKGLNFITNDIVLLLKHDGNKNWFDFHTMRKVQM
ncbi:hypothetical protein pdam_00009181 [Pocillopora damicornis]|uniref:Uncharacterized protein n=1 Tax=Pocillopora damicornis TaxID=46731 RepID=A0A3M6TTL4_POCDA|nr:hypothetical protein pdam_00009181 [Pocillopora damicornis]